MSKSSDARGRLSLLTLLALPASFLPGCGDEVTNHCHNFYGDGDGGADSVIPVPTATNYEPAGYYPSAYRITWDAQAKEYRIALTQLTWKTDN